jgi:protein TonB
MEGTPARERLQASGGVALLHALLAWALIAGFGVQVVAPASERLKLFDVIEPPPPPAPEPAPRPSLGAEGAAAPAGRNARPTPVVAPPPKLPPRSLVAAALEPAPQPIGTAPSAGSSDAGSGGGAGGEGSGAGSGGSGAGTGGGGTRAERIGGRLSGASDYPRGAMRAGAEGTVRVRYVVGTDGRVSGCRVTRSSGHAELDATTCRLIEQRFRYRPARDAAGRPVPETVSRTFDWLLPFRR